MAQSAKVNAQIFKRLTPKLKAANVILFVINHINPKIEINSFMPTQGQTIYLDQNESLPGGNTPLYLSNNILKTKTGTKLTAEKNPYGDFTGWVSQGKIVKSRTNRAGQDFGLIYNQEYGYDRILSAYEMLKSEKMVRGSGAWFYLDGLESIKFQQRNFKAKLEESIVFKQCFKELIQTCGSRYLTGNANIDATTKEFTEKDMDGLANDILADLMSDIS